MRKIILDCETRNTFADVGGSKPQGFDLSLLVVYDYSTDSYQTFLQEDLPKLWKILEETDLIIGYNSEHFDIPLLDKYYPGDLGRIGSLDLLVKIKQAHGRRLRLDSVAEGTLGEGKSGSGLDAIVWWRNGQIDKIAEYCRRDVKVTKDIYEYALKHGRLKYKDITGIGEFPISTKDWHPVKTEQSGINYTLPL